LFGGTGFDSTGGNGDLNDLWRYSPNSNLWTWMSGSNTAAANGVYGTQGTAAAGNVPGARAMAVSWTDSAGDLWLFGGFGNGPAQSPAVGPLNDLWRYRPSSNLWAWMSGSNMLDGAVAVYGTKGTAAPGNVPGPLVGGVSWTDATGNFWLLGGASGGTRLNDLWKYVPPTP
jgi:N-acetylneuraminic acid mutarotase